MKIKFNGLVNRTYTHPVFSNWWCSGLKKKVLTNSNDCI